MINFVYTKNRYSQKDGVSTNISIDIDIYTEDNEGKVLVLILKIVVIVGGGLIALVLLYAFLYFSVLSCCEGSDSPAPPQAHASWAPVVQPRAAGVLQVRQERPPEQRVDPASQAKYDQILSKCLLTQYNPSLNVYSQRDCTVCLDDFVLEVSIRILGCGHMFHDKCIEAWVRSRLNGRPKCPSCNNDLLNSKPIDLKNLLKKIDNPKQTSRLLIELPKNKV